MLVAEVSHDDVLPLLDQVAGEFPQFLHLAHPVVLDQGHEALGLLDLLCVQVHFSEYFGEANSDGQRGLELLILLVDDLLQPALELL